MTLGEKRLLDGKQGVHQLRDPDLDLDVGQVDGQRLHRADQPEDLLQPRLVCHRNPLEALEIQLFEFLEQLVDQLDRTPNLVLTSFLYGCTRWSGQVVLSSVTPQYHGLKMHYVFANRIRPAFIPGNQTNMGASCWRQP